MQVPYGFEAVGAFSLLVSSAPAFSSDPCVMPIRLALTASLQTRSVDKNETNIHGLVC